MDQNVTIASYRLARLLSKYLLLTKKKTFEIAYSDSQFIDFENKSEILGAIIQKHYQVQAISEPYFKIKNVTIEIKCNNVIMLRVQKSHIFLVCYCVQK